MNQDVDNQIGGATVDLQISNDGINFREPTREELYATMAAMTVEVRRGQTKKMSITETMLNTFSGMVISTFAQILIYPLFGIHVPWHTNVALCAIFTVISIVRSYFWRRLFNKLHEKGISL